MKISNGDLQLNMQNHDVTEHDTLDSAMTKYCQVCAAFWNEPSVKTGYVVIINNEFTIIEKMRIEHA
jgi:hypothetical protein